MNCTCDVGGASENHDAPTFKKIHSSLHSQSHRTYTLIVS